jgi:hypothetical protein
MMANELFNVPSVPTIATRGQSILMEAESFDVGSSFI